MNREALGAVAIALVAILALAVVSATVTSVVDPQGSGGGDGSGSGSPVGPETVTPESDDGRGSSDAGRPTPTTAREPRNYSELQCVRLADHPWVLTALFAGLVGVTAGVKRKYDSLTAVGFASIVGLIGVMGAALLQCTGWREPNKPSGASAGNATGSAEQPAGSVLQTVTDAPLWLFVIVGALAVAVAVVAVSQRGRIADVVGAVVTRPDEGDESVDDRTVAAVGRVAGRAADRIETGVDVENEVYRAWQAMTDHLEVDRPHSSTPAEFARAAIDAGLDPDDVHELTELFEAVRYGGEAATEERERRAIEALRRIERDAETEADADGSPDPRTGAGVDERGDRR